MDFALRFSAISSASSAVIEQLRELTAEERAEEAAEERREQNLLLLNFLHYFQHVATQNLIDVALRISALQEFFREVREIRN